MCLTACALAADLVGLAELERGHTAGYWDAQSIALDNIIPTEALVLRCCIASRSLAAQVCLEQWLRQQLEPVVDCKNCHARVICLPHWTSNRLSLVCR